MSALIRRWTAYALLRFAGILGTLAERVAPIE
jgi:hypothetical protein